MQPALLTTKPYRQSPNVVFSSVPYLRVFIENVCGWACGSLRIVSLQMWFLVLFLIYVYLSRTYVDGHVEGRGQKDVVLLSTL